MTYDIVERLRERGEHDVGMATTTQQLCSDAADEIERLRNALLLERQMLRDKMGSP